jgi:hypothetical protein
MPIKNRPEHRNGDRHLGLVSLRRVQQAEQVRIPLEGGGFRVPQTRLSMRKLKEVLRLHSLGLKQRQIARSCLIAQSTVHEYLKAAARRAGPPGARRAGVARQVGALEPDDAGRTAGRAEEHDRARHRAAVSGPRKGRMSTVTAAAKDRRT